MTLPIPSNTNSALRTAPAAEQDTMAAHSPVMVSDPSQWGSTEISQHIARQRADDVAREGGVQ